ncbi:MAG: hypothetical protein IJJ76_02180 [Ruminococcus sp.]|uniref:beta strand repeat-containing protein n=1 Tax=Ruminococcus sp. TaxID=41978 RepID=UPI0026000413|nr:hypothetical protein [Ruminococcus sp.]MBR0528557.1 hypothetical protein [Ruminococcus sp.]
MKKIKFPKMQKNRVKKLAKRVVAFMAATAMFLSSMPMGELSPVFNKFSMIIAHAVDPPRRAEVSYSDLNDFATYSLMYNANSYEYSEDIITLNLNTGATNTFPSNYIPLGTEENPFNGKIYINQTVGSSWWFETDQPIFDYVTDSAVVNYSSDDYNTEPIQIELRRKEKSAITPLFANHVTKGGSSKATWKIKSAVQTEDAGEGRTNILVCDTSGLIGDIQTDANVTIEFDNSAYDSGTGKRSDVQSSGDIGLICQTMYAGSQINLKLSGSNNGCLVTSSGGHAGGLVGRMYEGSKLQLNSTYTPDTNRSISTSAEAGYAGGLVGYNDGGAIIFPEGVETEIRGTITGTSGAGGLFGYYSNYVEDDSAQDITIDMRNYDIDCTVKATNAGGLFGVLNETADLIVDGSASGSNEITVFGDTVTNFGGITGTYQTNALTNSFEVKSVTANTSATFSGTSYYGGICGQITGNQAGYIKTSSLTHKSSVGFADATAFGGVVGNAGTAGSMLDVGSVTIETGVTTETKNGTAFKGGGIVGVLTDGVLRLSETTNMLKAPSSSGRSNGQLVGVRKDSLVYAVGSGNSGDSNWEFDRSTTQVNADDIGTWGTVLRLSGIETDVMTFDSDSDEHTVTVKAPVIAMTSAADFTRTALNMQLNNGDKGALKFFDSTNTKSALLDTALSFSGTIDLSESGNIGLMRDDYKDNVSEIGAYTKTISGGTIKLAIGERYGSPSTGVGRGDIIAHRYNGLIARTDTGAEVNGITIDGSINVNATIDGTHIGGAVADAKKGITLANVTAQEAINFNKISGANHVVGGMVADVSGENTNITGGTASPKIVLTGTVSDIPIGGAVGKIDNSNKEITVSGISVAADIDASGASASDFAGAGFISNISGGTMNLTGVTVSGTKLNNAASSHSGGFLGMQWLGTDVSFTANNGVTVSGTNTNNTTASFAAGLVQYATGHWTVPEKGIKITGMSITGVTNSLGLIVHDGYSGSNGLYLELTHKDSYYLEPTGLTIPSTTYYDELVRSTGSDILSNGSNGIISITTDGDLIMNGTSCNTYQNKYNKSNVSNSKSRYYYNLTSICAKATKSDGEKLLLWSLNKYAATNINSNFTNSLGTTLIGTFNLEHISYYPIDVDSNLSIGDATFIFYNDKIEASETGTGNSDSSNRTTHGASQHYLMHSGVFRNVSVALSTSGNIHFKGCIGVDSTYSGALINGTLSGSLTTANTKEIVFEGLTLSDPSKYLFINNMTTNSKLTLSGVRTGGGKDFSNADKSSTETKYASGATVASSLIGDVSGNGIQLSFTRMKLDSRTTEGAPADWLSQYGTTKSIFSGAIFLNRFAVDNNSTGVYNFEESLDWQGSTHNANVTYGQEIKTSVEYANEQQKYYKGANFVDPVDAPSSTRTEVYPFNSGFLPYVRYSTATVASGDNATRELKINVSVAGIESGCGTYNHPYEITEGWQLTNVATAINQTNYPDTLRLPKIQGTNYATAILNHWCETKNTSCAVFAKQSDNSFKFVESGTTYTWTGDQVSLYLASAYYVVKSDISITGAFPGLGATPASDTNKTGKYAFRGVIVGSSSDGSVKISMSVPKTSEISNYENTHGLITMSNGSVVKDLTIEVTPYTTDNYNYKVNGNQAYGYDEKFSNYGAVINKIMGGDNIIDNVSVNFTDNFKVNSSNDYKATVGGYVGCVVNGGLIFRNVDDSSLTNFVVKKVDSNGNIQNVTCNNNTITNLTDEKDLIHIHVNPFVGRVINGYAIRETDDGYGFSEDGAAYGDGEARANAVEVTMHNTRKNYSIPDIDTTNNNVLSFSQSAGSSTYDTITVPDSQALYIMSIIAQSGSGCASTDDGEYAYNISYCGGSGRNYSGNTAQNNKATHWANYSAIGNDTKGDDYNLSTNDTVNSKTAIPYIIYKYTSSYSGGTKYPARTLTKRTFYVNLVGGETYYLPDSFRGIGFLGSNTIDDNMKIYGFNGNGTTANPTVIDVNTDYYLNRKGDDPYFGSNINDEYKVGIGLFNNLKQSSSTGFDRKYESDSKYQITNFTMQGYLSAHHVDSSGNDQNANPTDNRDKVSMNTAGLVPTVLTNDVTLYNFSNILFEKLHINSYAYAGGFVAYTNDSGVMIYINNCNADGFKVEGSGRIAGFVGSFDTNTNDNSGIHINTGLDSSGKDSFTSVMKNTIINNRLSTDVKHNYTAGILGCVYSSINNSTIPADNGDNARGHLILRNVTIEGGNAETNYIGNKNNPNGSSGGILGGGSARVNGCLIQNCTVKNIDIYGKYAGGIMGENANRASSLGCSTGTRIVGCTVTGKLDENNNPQYTIMGLYYAGGVYGDIRDNNTNKHPKYKSVSAGDSDYVEYKTDIDGVYIYGYNIYSVNESNANKQFSETDNNTLKTCVAAGGLIGSNNENRTIQNCKVEKCVIDVGTKADSATNTPCGGLIGRMNSGTLYGYNIEVKDCDFLTHQWSNGAAINTQPAYATDNNTPVSGMKCGNVIGNGNSKTTNITAIHVENCPAPDDFNNVASSSFNVYADYNDVASSSDKGTEMSTLSVLPSGYTNVVEGGLKDYFPNVNVSPVTQMGDDTILTGDGAALYSKSGVDTPVIDAIVNDTDSNYTTAPTTAKTYIQHALQSTSHTGEPNKISTYKTEMGSLPDGVEDFTVLVINSTARDLSTTFINNYIQMVTNTSNQYSVVSGNNKTVNQTTNYKVDVYPCTYDGNKYVINASGKTAGLYVAHSNAGSNTAFEYYMQNTHADSNQGDYQFSLMDVQFFNPNTTMKEVAYHLYIPVLTKKMLMFEFYSASQSGTDNKSANFKNYGNTLAEALDSWYTAYLHFTYNQTELQSILESGAGLNWNGAKTVLLKYQTNDVDAKLGENTQIVLCDPNNADKYYYATLSGLRPNDDTDGENDTISFANFNTKLDGSGGSFTATTLNTMLLKQGFTIAEDPNAGNTEKIYAVTTNAAEADVIASDGTMYKKDESAGTAKLMISYPKDDGSGENDDSKVLEENYYLAVRANGSSVYNYSIRTPATTTGGTDKPTLRRSNVEEGNVTNLIMGNLYKQTVTINAQNNGKTSSEITSVDHRIDVTLTSLIQLTGTSSEKDYILGHLASNSNIHLYHSFIINLTAKDDTGERNEILGGPTATTDFTINGNNQPTYTEVDVQQKDISGSFIQLKQFDVKNYLSKTGYAMIKAETQIDFAEPWQYKAEFPTQDGSQAEVGVNVSAKSNLSYSTDKLRFTNMTEEPKPPSTKYFYIKESDKAGLVFNAKSEILDEYDKVGSPSFNYSQQGINPKNFIDDTQTRLPIFATATYNATNIKRSDFTDAEKVRYTLKLYKKTDDKGEVKYTEVSDISKYIDLTDADSVFIKVNSGVTSTYANGAKMTTEGNQLVYTADLDQTAFTSKDNQRITADIDFTVITGAGFKDYANYRFVLEVDLLKTVTNENDGSEELVSITNNSAAHDWIVYTNAKINPDMLTLSEYAAG